MLWLIKRASIVYSENIAKGTKYFGLALKCAFFPTVTGSKYNDDRMVTPTPNISLKLVYKPNMIATWISLPFNWFRTDQLIKYRPVLQIYPDST